MTYSHDTIISEFVDNKKELNGSNLYAENNVIYSYGLHFPLLVRNNDDLLIMNSDKYSITTSKHQSEIYADADIIIPFSALAGPLLKYGLPDSYYTPKSAADFIRLIDKKERDTFLFTLKVNKNEAYFLASMDENHFYLCELPGPCETVTAALEKLKPKRLNTDKYKRQGEWFFIDISDKIKGSLTKLYDILTPNLILPQKRNNSNPHAVTRGGFIFDLAFKKPYIKPYKATDCICMGTVKHPHHNRLSLTGNKSKSVWIALENRAIEAWSSSGDVD